MRSDLEWAEMDYAEKCARLALGENVEEAVAELEAEMDRLRAALRRTEAAVTWLWNEVGPVGTGATSPVAA